MYIECNVVEQYAQNNNIVQNTKVTHARNISVSDVTECTLSIAFLREL